MPERLPEDEAQPALRGSRMKSTASGTDLKYDSEKKRRQGRGADRQYQQNCDGKFLLLYLCARF